MLRYVGSMGRDDATELLGQKAHGTYFVRMSIGPRKGDYALSIKWVQIRRRKCLSWRARRIGASYIASNNIEKFNRSAPCSVRAYTVDWDKVRRNTILIASAGTFLLHVTAVGWRTSCKDRDERFLMWYDYEIENYVWHISLVTHRYVFWFFKLS